MLNSSTFRSHFGLSLLSPLRSIPLLMMLQWHAAAPQLTATEATKPDALCEACGNFPCHRCRLCLKTICTRCRADGILPPGNCRCEIPHRPFPPRRPPPRASDAGPGGALSKTEIASVACIVYGNRTCELPCTMQRKPQCRRAGGYPCIFPRGVWHSLHYCAACKLDDDDDEVGAPRPLESIWQVPFLPIRLFPDLG